MGRGRALSIVAVAALAATLGLASTASARDPGKWVLTGASSVPNNYWQGLTSSPPETDVYFVGVFQGLWQTTPQLEETAGNSQEIPSGVTKREGYNHIGDPTWLGGEGGRVLLPMECYTPNADPSNTCGTGAFGIADPRTLRFRYYVKLDPRFIPKAMWAETSPDGSLIWTSAGDDLLAYKASKVVRKNSAPAGRLLKPARRLRGAVPPTGITGAVFRKNKLLLAGEKNHDYRVWAVDPKTGDQKLQIEKHICGESEGLDTISTLGGRLHWLIAPSDPGCELTFGPTSALLHFRHAPPRKRFKVKIKHLVEQIDAEGAVRVDVTVRVKRRGGKPVRHANVRFAGEYGRTNKHGRTKVSAALERPGRFAAFARKGKRYGRSKLAPVGIDESASARSALPPAR